MTQINIIVGSIQGTVFSYVFDLETGKFTKIFTTNDHVGKLRDIHISKDNLLITSGVDENIKVYNLKKNEKISNIYGLDGITN